MCVSLALFGAATNAGAAVASGNMLQAGASGLNALASLASGSTRARASSADAAWAAQAGRDRASRIRDAGAQELARARADATGAGVSVGSGSVLEAERKIVRGVEQDAGVAILNGDMRAQQFRDQAGADGTNGVLGAIGSLVTMADKWKRSSAAMDGLGPVQPQRWHAGA